MYETDSSFLLMNLYDLSTLFMKIKLKNLMHGFALFVSYFRAVSGVVKKELLCVLYCW